jgi:hypothetical protein
MLVKDFSSFEQCFEALLLYYSIPYVTSRWKIVIALVLGYYVCIILDILTKPSYRANDLLYISSGIHIILNLAYGRSYHTLGRGVMYGILCIVIVMCYDGLLGHLSCIS